MQADENVTGFESLTIQETEDGTDASANFVLENSDIGHEEKGIELYILIQQASGLAYEVATELRSFVSIGDGEQKVPFP